MGIIGVITRRPIAIGDPGQLAGGVVGDIRDQRQETGDRRLKTDGFSAALRVERVALHVTIGVGQSSQAAEEVVGALDRAGCAINRLGFLDEATELIVLKAGASRPIGDFHQLAFGVELGGDGGIVGVGHRPWVGDAGAGGDGVAFLRQPIERIVEEADGDAAGVGLGGEVVHRVVGVGPAAHVRIIHGQLAAEGVVIDSSDMTTCIDYSDEIVERVVGVGGGVRLRTGELLDRREAPGGIRGTAGAVAVGIGEGDGGIVIRRGGRGAVGISRGEQPAERIVGIRDRRREP